MASSAIKSNSPLPPSPARGREPDILPSLFGAGYGTYQTRPRNFILSFVLHTLSVVLILVITTYVAHHPKEITYNVPQGTDISPYLPSSIFAPSGGGGARGAPHKQQAPT